MIRWISVVLLTLLYPLSVCGQGVPLIHHYSSEEIGTHPQIWSVTQDDSGFLYFGSQGETIQEFDSVDWESLQYKPDTGAIRSLQLFNSKIHWGAVGDFGYLESDSLNKFRLVSLKNQIDSTRRSFADVWQIVEFDEKLYHRTSDAILILEQDTVKVVESEERLRGIFKAGDELWVQREASGLNRMVNYQWKPIEGPDPFTDDRLIEILKYPDYKLLIFRNHGFVKYQNGRFTDLSTGADDYLQEHSLYRATAINETDIALAFLNGGVVVMSNDGTIQHILTEENGLPTNVIYEVYKDREGTLWATSSDGVIKILANNPLTAIQEQNGFDGSTKFIESLEGTVYIGSTHGLFLLEDENEVHKHPGIDELVYDAIQLNGTLYASFPSGLFRILGNESENILKEGSYRKLEIPGNSGNTFLELIGIPSNRLP